MIAIDTETTGLDLHHGAKPYLVTICHPDGEQKWWEWDVDPKTREPFIPKDELREVQLLVARMNSWQQGVSEEVSARHYFVTHNGKFDVASLRTIGIEGWPWKATNDTLIASHLLASNQPHDLTSLGVHYLGIDIEPLEKKLEKSCKEARNLVRARKLPWRIAREGEEDMPSATAKAWKADGWLLRAVAQEFSYPEDHHYWTDLANYANADSAMTMQLWKVMEDEMRHRGLWEIYLERMKVIPIAWGMEQRGVTISVSRLEELEKEFTSQRDRAERLCTNMAQGYTMACPDCPEVPTKIPCIRCNDSGIVPFELVLPKAGVNQSLNDFVFNCLKLEAVKHSKTTGRPSLDKSVMEAYEQQLPEKSKQLFFIRNLAAKRKRDTALQYMTGYRRYWMPMESQEGWCVLYPSFNPTGTDTLRWSSKNPNLQNCSKADGFNLRYAFGPAPGREWWCLDYENIELRIPAYESGEQVMVELFEKPDEPPYYGSYHLVNASIVYPDLFWPLANEKGAFKKKYAATYYQWIKNFGFACVPMDTEALTRDGWKKYEELQVGDLVLGHEDGVLKWTPVLGKIALDDAPLVHMHNNHVSMVTTPDHRWLTRKRTGRNPRRYYKDLFATTEEITREHEIYLSFPVADESLLDITDTEAAIIGFVYSDGSVRKSQRPHGTSRGSDGEKVGFDVHIYQSKPRGVEYLNLLLAAWGKPYRYYDYTNKAATWKLDQKACRDIWRRAGIWETQDFEKLVLSMGQSQRKAYLEAIWQAEGCLDRYGNKLYAQNEGAFAESIKLAIYMCGNTCTFRAKSTTYPTAKTCLDIRASKAKVTGQRLVKEKVANAPVWCLQTELGTWVMRQGGHIYLTGNCQYGALPESGTADRAARVIGAQRKVMEHLKEHTKLNKKYIDMANKLGYVETLPDKTVNPKRGYPILCTRTEYGKISPTVPLNYHVQSTAMWCTMKAMIRCQEYLDELNRGIADPTKHYHMSIQVHDEIVFDMPALGSGNLPVVQKLKKLMELSGEDIDIPLRVAAAYHPTTWAKGEDLQ